MTPDERLQVRIAEQQGAEMRRKAIAWREAELERRRELNDLIRGTELEGKLLNFAGYANLTEDEAKFGCKTKLDYKIYNHMYKGVVQ